MSSWRPTCFEGQGGFCVNIGVDTPEEAERLFNALSEKAEIRMPCAETIWALGFGMLVDQFWRAVNGQLREERQLGILPIGRSPVNARRNPLTSVRACAGNHPVTSDLRFPGAFPGRVLWRPGVPIYQPR